MSKRFREVAEDVKAPDAAGDVAGRKGSSWQQRASAYVAELQADLERVEAGGKLSDEKVRVLRKAKVQLLAARDALNRTSTPMSLLSGSAMDRAWTNIHRAELGILRISEDRELTWWGTEVLSRTKRHLAPDDPLRTELEAQVAMHGHHLDVYDRDLAVRALRAANDAQDLERSRARSFRNILLTSVLVTTAIASALFVWGFIDPQAIAKNLCFKNPRDQFFCAIGTKPSGSDVLLVEFFGLCGAALAGAVSLRHMQGTATPYMVPTCLLLLRLPVGALAAVFGLLVINGGFVPGLSNLDRSSQVLAWALVFGVAQESLTRLVDQQGKKILRNVRGPSRGPENELPGDVREREIPNRQDHLRTDGAPTRRHSRRTRTR